MTIALALHGGAGALSEARIPRARLDEMRRDLARALSEGASILARGGSALDAVVASVCVLEDSPVFNAARGAVLRRDGQAYLDASVMEGERRRAGAVCLVQTPRNPVRLARVVLERGREVLLSGAAADRLAHAAGLPIEPLEYFVTEHRVQQLERLRERGGVGLDHDVDVLPGVGLGPLPDGEQGQTVGAVALDAAGHLAAATSTGGMTNADVGRVGDTPIIGAGTWACDSSCAVSATGSGEFFIRSAFAHDVHARVWLASLDLDRAARGALGQVERLGGYGGCVAVDTQGHVVAPFTTLAMPRAYMARDGVRHVYVLEPEARPLVP